MYLDNCWNRTWYLSSIYIYVVSEISSSNLEYLAKCIYTILGSTSISMIHIVVQTIQCFGFYQLAIFLPIVTQNVK